MGIINYCSIVMGADRSILALRLPYGLKFEVLSINDLFINNKIYNYDNELQANYIGHIINGNEKNPQFICLTFSENSDYKSKNAKIEDSFQKFLKTFNILKLFSVENIGLYSIFSKYDGCDWSDLDDAINVKFKISDIKASIIIDSVVLNHATYSLTSAQVNEIETILNNPNFDKAYLLMEDVVNTFS